MPVGQDDPRLSRGSHRTPGEGMCVMELASVMAGERFTDRPRCVDPVISAYLRAFNDRLGHADRQRLAPLAGRCVGTRAGREVQRARRDLCLQFAEKRVLGRGRVARRLALSAVRTRIAVLIGIRPALRLSEGAGELAARCAFVRRDPDAGFGLLDALLREGAPPEREGTPEARREPAPAPA